jgi:hypothetical protein
VLEVDEAGGLTPPPRDWLYPIDSARCGLALQHSGDPGGTRPEQPVAARSHRPGWGRFSDHVLQGTLFLAVGLWRVWSAFAADPPAFRVRAWSPLPKGPRLLELYVVAGGAFLDMSHVPGARGRHLRRTRRWRHPSTSARSPSSSRLWRGQSSTTGTRTSAEPRGATILWLRLLRSAPESGNSGALTPEPRCSTPLAGLCVEPEPELFFIISNDYFGFPSRTQRGRAD